MSKFELSLAKNYVADWTIVESVREFFQNALDQATEQTDNKMFFDYDESTETLSIGNEKSVLEAQTLLLGTTTKTNSENTIGQFGEGYKVATLVALREGKTVIFYNWGKKEIWKPRFVKSRKYGTEILTFFTESHIWQKAPQHALIIEIKGITADEYEDIKKTNLHIDGPGEIIETTRGNILLDSEFHHKVFVNGLFVTEQEEMKYGYDIKPAYLKLDRDRRAVGSFDLHWQTSTMWAESGDDTLVKLLRDNAPDVEYVANQYNYSIKNEIRTQAYDEFKSAFGDNAVPVVSQSELEAVQKRPDLKPVMVSSTMQKVVQSAPDYQQVEASTMVLDMEDKVIRWITKHREELPQEAFEELLDILERDWSEVEAIEEEEDHEVEAN